MGRQPSSVTGHLRMVASKRPLEDRGTLELQRPLCARRARSTKVCLAKHFKPWMRLLKSPVDGPTAGILITKTLKTGYVTAR
jgi:hypothetical protein